MAARVWMLELGRNYWRLTTNRDEALALVAEQDCAAGELTASAMSIQETLAAAGYRGESIALALNSDWCLAATLSVERRQELRDRQTLLYRLEEWIPWCAEDCVADFLPAEKQALVVTVPVTPLDEFLARLASLGVEVSTIVPTALLACAEHVSLRACLTDDVVLFQQQNWIDVIWLEKGQPAHWSWTPASTAALRQELANLALELGDAVPVIAYALEDSLYEALTQDHHLIGCPIRAAAGVSRQSLALAAAEKITSGKLPSPLELKRGPFGRTSRHVALHRPWQALQLAVAVLLLTITASLFYHGRVSSHAATQLSLQQEEAFRNVFPNAKIPVGIKNRLESELAKLKGLQGDDTLLPKHVSVSGMLYRLLGSLPTDRRFRLLEIRLEEGRLYLDGEVRDHGDAEALAQRLRTQGFEVPPPKTQRMDEQRVSLRITGALAQTEEMAEGKSR